MIRSLNSLPDAACNWLATRTTPAAFAACLIGAIAFVGALEGLMS